MGTPEMEPLACLPALLPAFGLLSLAAFGLLSLAAFRQSVQPHIC